jgi:hypothetical protein
MSVRKRGKRFEVRWSEAGRKLSRTFLRAEDARAFDVEMTRRRQLGPLAPGVIQSRQTLAGFMEAEWWPRYAIPNLAPETRRRYLEVWGTHLLPALGDVELRQITPNVVEDLRERMARGGVGVPTQRKTLMLLQGILRRAVVRGLVPVNVAQLIDKPRQKPTVLPQPLTPLTVERIRAIMLEPRTRTVPRPSRASDVGAHTRRRSPANMSVSATHRSFRCSPTPACARWRIGVAHGAISVGRPFTCSRQRPADRATLIFSRRWPATSLRGGERAMARNQPT